MIALTLASTSASVSSSSSVASKSTRCPLSRKSSLGWSWASVSLAMREGLPPCAEHRPLACAWREDTDSRSSSDSSKSCTPWSASRRFSFSWRLAKVMSVMSVLSSRLVAALCWRGQVFVWCCPEGRHHTCLRCQALGRLSSGGVLLVSALQRLVGRLEGLAGVIGKCIVLGQGPQLVEQFNGAGLVARLLECEGDLPYAGEFWVGCSVYAFDEGGEFGCSREVLVSHWSFLSEIGRASGRERG